MKSPVFLLGQTTPKGKHVSYTEKSVYEHVYTKNSINNYLVFKSESSIPAILGKI